MRIEAARQAVQDLPITPAVLATLGETARLYSTHYSTMIEGNRLTHYGLSAREVPDGSHLVQSHVPGYTLDLFNRTPNPGPSQ
jgi:hypothetical protein